MATQRLDIVDGIRGHLLLGMMIAHLHLRQAPLIGTLHHKWVIDFWDAEFFVLISGFMCGLLARNKYGLGAGLRAFLIDRARLIFIYIVGSQLLVAVIETPDIPSPADILSIFVLNGASDLGAVLDLYFWCFIIALAAFALVPSVLAYLAISAAVYLVTIAAPVPGLFGYGAATFSIPTWNLLFAIGLATGWFWPRITAGLADMPRTSIVAAFAASTALWLVLRVFPVYPAVLWVPGLSPVFEARDMLHPVYLVKILAFTLAAFLLVHARILPWIADLARWWFARPFLQALGRCSIQSFAFHVVLIAAYTRLVRPEDPVWNFAIALIATALFILFPRLRNRFRSRLSARAHPAGPSTT